MIEMSFEELALLCWAVLATGYALKFKAERDMTARSFMHLVRDEKAREEIVSQWEKFKKARGA